jgi:hypothetical protein
MNDARHPAELSDEQLQADCEVRFQRRTGPGGQHRNKVETAVYVTHRPSGIRAGATERRSQAANRAAALDRLRISLAVQVRADWSEPSSRWRARCRNQRLQINPRHADFAPMLAEALDALAELDWSLPEAAQQLDCTASQLLGLLRDEPRALKELNDQRRQRGGRPLR